MDMQFSEVAEEMHAGAAEFEERQEVLAAADQPKRLPFEFAMRKAMRRSGRYVSDGCGCVERVSS